MKNIGIRRSRAKVAADTERNRKKRLCIGICIYKDLAVFMQVSNVTFDRWVKMFRIRFSLSCHKFN
jgi:hypothetical protein